MGAIVLFIKFKLELVNVKIAIVRKHLVKLKIENFFLQCFKYGINVQSNSQNIAFSTSSIKRDFLCLGASGDERFILFISFFIYLKKSISD
jgi:hypothetical protein